MSLENPEIQESKKIRSHEEETAVLGNAAWFQSTFVDDLENCHTPQAASEVIKEILVNLEKDLGEKAQGLSQSVENLDPADFETMNGYVVAASKAAEVAMDERMSLAEREEIERESVLSYDSNIDVNRVVYFNITEEGKQLSINFHHAKSLPAREAIRIIEDGLKEIANSLKGNAEFASVQEIYAKSWLIQKHPKIFERYGFNLSGPDSATMSREDYLRRYGA